MPNALIKNNIEYLRNDLIIRLDGVYERQLDEIKMKLANISYEPFNKSDT